WLNQALTAPGWLGTTKTVNAEGKIYEIQFRNANTEMVDVLQAQIRSEIDFIEQGPDWSISRFQLTRTINGKTDGQAITGLLVDGPGNTAGLWKSPQVLRNLQPGVLDHDPILNTTVSYELNADTQTTYGVIRETDAGKEVVRTYGYDLTSGMLVFEEIDSLRDGFRVKAKIAP
ncbi:MAG: hypothetical protein AAF348_14980, partial [Bacteroidota bacterium]